MREGGGRGGFECVVVVGIRGWGVGCGCRYTQIHTHQHTQGLKQQVEELLAVAQAPCNAWRWQQPRVALYFPSGQVMKRVCVCAA